MPITRETRLGCGRDAIRARYSRNRELRVRYRGGDSLELHLSPQFHPLDERKKVDEEGRFVGRLFEWCARVQRNIRRLIDSDSSLLYI